MFKKLLPKKHRFFELFEQQTAFINKGLDLFELLIKEYSRQEDLILSEANELERTDRCGPACRVVHGGGGKDSPLPDSITVRFTEAISNKVTIGNQCHKSAFASLRVKLKNRY